MVIVYLVPSTTADTTAVTITAVVAAVAAADDDSAVACDDAVIKHTVNVYCWRILEELRLFVFAFCSFQSSKETCPPLLDLTKGF